MKPRFTLLALFGGVTYFACLLAVARSIPVVERSPTLGRFGGVLQLEYVEVRRAPSPSEVFFGWRTSQRQWFPSRSCSWPSSAPALITRSFRCDANNCHRPIQPV